MVAVRILKSAGTGNKWAQLAMDIGVLNRPGPVCNRYFLGFVGSPVYRFRFSIVVLLGVLPCQAFVAM